MTFWGPQANEIMGPTSDRDFLYASIQNIKMLYSFKKKYLKIFQQTPSSLRTPPPPSLGGPRLQPLGLSDPECRFYFLSNYLLKYMKTGSLQILIIQYHTTPTQNLLHVLMGTCMEHHSNYPHTLDIYYHEYLEYLAEIWDHSDQMANTTCQNQICFCSHLNHKSFFQYAENKIQIMCMKNIGIKICFCFFNLENC